MPGRGLCLLSLDGGGIRGLSSLLMLEHLMDKIDPDNPPKPCDYFDMIGGTSTGGLIAIMLGRLRMSVADCIDAYMELSGEVFQKKHYLPVKLNGELRDRFDTKALENAIKNIVRPHGGDEDLLMKDTGQPSTKTFVCATSGEAHLYTVKLRSYRNPWRTNELLKSTKLWEAGRATSAASTFFEPVEIGPYGERFVDGATGSNNPIRELWAEAGDVWRDECPLQDNIHCLVSIGTGAPAIHAFGSSLAQLAHTLKELATETEKTASTFEQEQRQLVNDFRYFRFNVTKGLENVGLEEIGKRNVVAAATGYYLSSEEISRQMQRCGESLKGRIRSEVLSLSPLIATPPISTTPSTSASLPTNSTSDLSYVRSTESSSVESGGKRNLRTWVKSKFSRDEKHLIDAAMKGDIVRVQSILSRSTNSTLDQEAKNKALIEASTNDRLSSDQGNIVELLIDNGAKIDVQGRKSLPFIGAIWQNKNQRRTPLIWAICYGQTQIVETLLFRGAQVEIRDDELRLTPLMWAAYCGYEAIAALFITRASLEAVSDRGMTPLMLAVVEQHEDIVELLVNNGANVECKVNGMPALCIAANKGNCKVVQALIDGGAAQEAKDDVEGRTALIWAIASLKYDVVDLLIVKGADKVATDKNGYTAEDWLRGDGLAFIEHVGGSD